VCTSKLHAPNRSETLSDEASRIEALRAGLHQYGYVEGKNIPTEIRTADGNYERLRELAVKPATNYFKSSTRKMLA
jgi:hypothetical protein